MREIKFRAWDVKIERWTSSCNIVISLHGKEIYWNFGYEPLKTINKEELVIQQFTGLYDKNGKEIYEGDILKYKFAVLSGVDEISFRSGKFILKNSNREISNTNDYGEVIGNIYENPELLKC